MNENRDKIIIRTSIIGIFANIFLAGFKAVVGIMSNSIAIVMDAVNNISVAASSIITIAGTKLAGKQADKKHPFGYGRIEYMSVMVISMLVLYAGITAFLESVKKIIHPDTPDYSKIALVIVAVAVIVKFILGRYVKNTGEAVNSDSLINSGEDAKLDSVISLSTLLAAGIYIFFHISVEAYLGAVIALIIIKSGFEMLRDTLSKILGERADAQLARDIKETIMSYPEIKGAYDLVLHNYGPNSFHGSVHIEVPDVLTADTIDEITRKVTFDVYRKYNVILTGIGVYSFNTKDAEIVAIREKIFKIASENPYVLQTHGFYADKAQKTIRFDVIVSFDAKDRNLVYNEIKEKVQAEYPDYSLEITLDTDFSE